MKKFKLGLVLGRFNHMHNGHVEIVEISRQLCDRTLILVGSASECGTLRNPFNLETRKNVIKRIYGDSKDVIIGALNDMTNEDDICFEWGRYILDNVKQMYGEEPDLMVYGKDESRKSWFCEEDSAKFSEVIVTRDKIKISATELRKYLVEDNETEWKKYTSDKIWDMYSDLRRELLEIDVYRENLRM